MCLIVRVKKIFSLAALGGFFAANLASPQTWTQTSAPITNWSSVASSADGIILVAAVGNPASYTGGIFISTNFGDNWFQADLPGNNFCWGVASSADGSKLAVTFDNGGNYCSTNFGTTWISNSTNFAPAFVGLAHNIVSSSDGTKLAVVGGSIFTSTNGGTSWLTPNLAATRLASVASSADGNKLAAVALGGSAVFLSTNAGATWITSNVPHGAFQDISMSADGSHLIAAGSEQIGGYIYISSDSGMTWTSNNATGNDWSAVASSADGTHLAAAANASISVSTNGGAVWATTNIASLTGPGYIHSLAFSADGAQLVAVVSGSYQPGGIYILQTIRPPKLNLTPTNGNLSLSWLIPSTNFVLQQSADLSSWTDLANQPVLNLTNLQNQVTLPSPASNVFYRLKTP